MDKSWIKISDNLPKNGEWVLAYWYEDEYEVEQYHVLLYCKKGYVIDRKMCKSGGTAEANLLKTLFDQEYEIKAEVDGFYFIDTSEDGDTEYRKHADIITHWQPLKRPAN